MAKPFLTRALAVAALLGSGGVALGYVLPGGAILRRMSKVRDEQRLSAVRIEGTLALSGSALVDAGGPPGGPDSQGDATVSIRLPGRCRLDATAPDGAKLAVVSSNGKRRADGPAVEALATVLDELCAFFGTRAGSESAGRSALEAHLRSRNIDPRPSSLARFGGQVAYVLGPTKEGSPQLWVFKDSFLPARVRWTDGQLTQWDVRFLDYNSPATGDWFPRVVEAARNGERLMRFAAVKGDSRASLADRLF